MSASLGQRFFKELDHGIGSLADAKDLCPPAAFFGRSELILLRVPDEPRCPRKLTSEARLFGTREIESSRPIPSRLTKCLILCTWADGRQYWTSQLFLKAF